MEKYYSCKSLTSLDLTNFDTSKVTDMNTMFSQCRALHEINGLGNFNTSKVTNMHCMFEYLVTVEKSLDLSVKNVILGELEYMAWDVSKVEDFSGMFTPDDGFSLESIDLSNWNTMSAKYMNNMFGNCDGLTSLDLSSFDTANVTNMESMFCYCSGLTMLDLSSFDTSNVKKMSYMFKNCANLTTIYKGNGWDDTLASKTDMFTGCGTSTLTLKP